MGTQFIEGEGKYISAQELIYTPLFSDPNLQGYYRMESNWNDSKNSNNLTAHAGPTFVTGKFGNAGSFASGSSQYSDIAAFEYTTSFTYMCWFNRTSGTDQAIMSKTNAAATVLRRIYVVNDTTINFHVDGLTTNNSVSTVATSTATTYFLAGVYDSTNSLLKIWLNSTKTQLTCGGTPTASTGNFSIGRDGSYSNYLNGWVDDAAVFNRALTDTEILNYYNGTFAQAAFLLNFI